MTVKLEDIYETIMMTDQDSKYFLDKETGGIELLNEMIMSSEEYQELCDRLDEHGFYRLPTQYEIRDYDIMEAFAYTLSGTDKQKLLNALQGRGAFRRFKDTVNYLSLSERWYSFQDKAYMKMAAEWCEENDIDYI